MSFGMAYATKKRCMAKGGKVKSDYSGGQKRGPEGYPKYQEQAQNEKGVHTPVSGVTAFPGGKGTSGAGSLTKDRYAGKPTFSGKDHPAIKEHHRVLSEMKSTPKPTSGMSGFAEGGDVSEHEQDADMIARIMHKRKQYAQGGVVANEDAPIADSMPAEFDDMEVDDHLEQHEHASDEIGDDDVGDDPIDRIMMKRKKDKMPRPA